MATIINTKLGESKGQSRIWLEGVRLERGGFSPSTRYELAIGERQVTIKAASQGTYTVSKRMRNGKLSPIIDLSNQRLTQAFEGVEMLRVLIRNGSIVISAHFQQGKVEQREQRLLDRLTAKLPLTTCSLYHGGGVLDKALHAGFVKTGIASTIAMAVEQEGAYIDNSLMNNPELWTDSSLVINAPIETLSYCGPAEAVDIVIAGIPCTGASKAGKAKNKLEFAESHDAAGSMFFYVLQIVQKLNPSMVILECVPDFRKTASMAVIRTVLSSLNYTVTEQVLDGSEFGAFEKRKRLCVVALSSGLPQFDFTNVVSLRTKEACLGEILEHITDDSPRWKTFDYLADKEIRDIEAGKGFRRQLLDASATTCGVVTKDYAKCRSTDPFYQHPTMPHLSRLFTPVEHAKVKAIPLEVIAGLSNTVAHQILGQSVIYPLFVALGIAIGNLLNDFGESLGRTSSIACQLATS